MKKSIIMLFVVPILCGDAFSANSATRPVEQNILEMPESVESLAGGLGEDGSRHVKWLDQSITDAEIVLSENRYPSEGFKKNTILPMVKYSIHNGTVIGTCIDVTRERNKVGQINKFADIAIGEGKTVMSYDWLDGKRGKIDKEDIAHLEKTNPGLAKAVLERRPTWFLVQADDGTVYSVELGELVDSHPQCIAAYLRLPPTIPSAAHPLSEEFKTSFDSFCRITPREDMHNFLGVPVGANTRVSNLGNKLLSGNFCFSISVSNPIRIQYRSQVVLSDLTEYVFRDGKLYGIYFQVYRKNNDLQALLKLADVLKAGSCNARTYSVEAGKVYRAQQALKTERRPVTCVYVLRPGAIWFALFPEDDLPEGGQYFEPFIIPDDLSKTNRIEAIKRKITTQTEKIDNFDNAGKILGNESLIKTDNLRLAEMHLTRAVLYDLNGEYEKALQDLKICQEFGGAVSEQFIKKVQTAIKNKLK